MKQLSYTTWGSSKDIASTTWGTDWDYCGIADHIVITLNLSPHCIQEASIVTIPPFQHSCSHKSYQHLEFSYHIYCYCFLVRANDYLTSIIDSNEIWFMWASFLIHSYRITILWHFSVVFVLDQYCHYLLPEFLILFASGFEWLIVWRWLKYHCLYRGTNEFHIFEHIVNFIVYKAWFCWWWEWYLIWLD